MHLCKCACVKSSTADSARTILPVEFWPGYPTLNREYKTMVKMVVLLKFLSKNDLGY